MKHNVNIHTNHRLQDRMYHWKDRGRNAPIRSVYWCCFLIHSVTSQLQRANYQWPRFEIVITWNGEMWIPTREILQTSTPQLIASNTWSSRSNRFVKIYLLMYPRHIPFNFEKKPQKYIFFSKKKNTPKNPPNIFILLYSYILNH